MKRSKHWSPAVRCRWAALAVIIVVLTSASWTHAQLVLSASNYRDFKDTGGQFNLRFTGTLNETGPIAYPPSFSSSQWKDLLSNRVILAFDTVWLGGLAGIPERDPFWTFMLGVSAEFEVEESTGSLTAVRNLMMELDGQHLEGPSPEDEDPNTLPRIDTRRATFSSDDMNHRNVRLKAFREVNHFHVDNDLGIDSYKFSAVFKVDFPTGVGQILGTPDRDVFPHIQNIEISASHIHPTFLRSLYRPPDPTGATLSVPGSIFFFDATLGRLFVSPALVGSADLMFPVPGGEGGSALGQSLLAGAGAGDPPFAGDPVLGSFIHIESPSGFDSVPYLGFDPARGLHVFGGGSLGMANADFTFNAEFDEVVYDPVSGHFTAEFSTVQYNDVLDTAPSEFLEFFTDQHLFGDDPRSRGMMLRFSAPGLAEMTNSFTEDGFPEEPVTFFLTGVKIIPEPTTLVLCLAAAAIGIAGRRRRRSN